METKRICPGCRRPLADDAPQGLCPQCLVKAGLGSGVSIDPETKSSQPHFIAPSLEELSGRFPQLEIISFVGQGGMGAVYKARQKQLDRVVALKILPPGIGQEPSFAERFSREAKALAKLDHPGIVTIHDFGQADGLFFFVMEFVDGLNLRQLLQSGRISPREALAIVPQICDALQYAHDVGIVHRDIKPENILLDRRGRVKVADFGLAKLVEVGNELISDSGTASGSAALTEAGRIIGTPNYIAPEQMDHPGEVDHRADIYALGVVLYQMLTGELPGKPISPPSGKVHIDVRLDEVVLRALELKPERRYQQASVLKTDVETIALTPGAAPSMDQRAINEAEWRNPKNWSLGLYFSKRDSRSLWVPRRLRGFGWTINLGHWQGAAFLLGSIVLLVLLLLLGIHSKHNNTPAVEQRAVPSPKPVLAVPAEKGDIAVHQPAAGFGPITERTLSIRGNECDFLSFRTGQVLRHSYFDGDQRDSTPPTAFRQWVHEHGVDIGFCASTEKFYGPLGLLALDMGTYMFPYDAVPQDMIPRFRSVAEWQTYDAQHEMPANNPLIGSLAGVTNIWDDLTADQIEGPTNEPPAFFLKEKQLSLWFRSINLTTHPIAFSIRDGVQGLLQIIGFTENPPVLKLRYKLVSHARSAEKNSKLPNDEPRQISQWAASKPLSGWISELQSPEPNVRKLAESAITELGTNALTELLKILGDRDSSLEADVRRYNAASALRFIGHDVKSAIPSFVALLVSGNQQSAYAGARALAFTAPIVPESFSALTNGLIDPTPGVRDAATYAVGLLPGSGSNQLAEEVLPALLRNLKDPAQFVRADTATALEMYVQNARTHGLDQKAGLIIPAVIELLHDNHSGPRESAAMVFQMYGRAAAPVLLGLLTNQDSEVRECATNALGIIRYTFESGTNNTSR